MTTEQRSDHSYNPVLDVDAHEMVPSFMWRDIFGDAAGDIADLNCQRFSGMAENSLQGTGEESDTTEICDDTVWNVKGVVAPSAIDLDRRPAVLDQMGVERQLVFPTFALMAFYLMCEPRPHDFLGYDPALVGDPYDLGQRAIVDHNEWAARVTARSSERVRPVGIVLTESIDAMVESAEHLISEGIRAIMVPTGAPPAGTSPADRALDPFWSVLAANDVPFCLHIGPERPFFASHDWGANVDVFVPSGQSSIEFPVQPLYASMFHYPIEVWLSSMILGGVLERHPALRVGAIEVGAYWLGPLAARLEIWFEEFSRRLSPSLSRRPTEVLAEHVRVTPFHFEPLLDYVEQCPDLIDCYAYATDFPHREGGTDSLRIQHGKIASCGSDIVSKFFYSNGELLLPA